MDEALKLDWYAYCSLGFEEEILSIAVMYGGPSNTQYQSGKKIKAHTFTKQSIIYS